MLARPLGQEQDHCKTKSYNTSCTACNGADTIYLRPMQVATYIHIFRTLASFLAIFNFLCPSVLDLGPGTGQTDNGHQSIMSPSLWRRGIIMKNSLT